MNLDNFTDNTPCSKWQGSSIYHSLITPFKPEFAIVIFIHYKPRIDVAIHDL